MLIPPKYTQLKTYSKLLKIFKQFCNAKNNTALCLVLYFNIPIKSLMYHIACNAFIMQIFDNYSTNIVFL